MNLVPTRSTTAPAARLAARATPRHSVCLIIPARVAVNRTTIVSLDPRGEQARNAGDFVTARFEVKEVSIAFGLDLLICASQALFGIYTSQRGTQRP